MQKTAFTLIELIFVIVIIGVLAAFAVPKFSGLTSNSKISAELATASTIQSAIDDVHSEWIMNEDGFTWGNHKDQDDVNDEGYPKKLGDCNDTSPIAFNWILKASSVTDAKWTCKDNNDGTFTYHGPASSTNSGVSENGNGKPDTNDAWEYNTTDGTFNSLED